MQPVYQQLILDRFIFFYYLSCWKLSNKFVCVMAVL